MNTRFYGVIFGGETESVESHRFENVIAGHFLKTRVTVGHSEIIPMTEMKLGSARIREHFEHIELLVRSVFIEGVKFSILPYLVPLFFDFYVIHKLSFR